MKRLDEIRRRAPLKDHVCRRCSATSTCTTSSTCGSKTRSCRACVARATLLRFADDFVIGFSHSEDAERVMEVLGKRLGKYGLTLQPEKTRLIPFVRPLRRQTAGKGPGTFDFLGFSWYWRRARSGLWVLASNTRRDRLKRTIRELYRWCRRHRHRPISEQHAGLCRRIRGHMNYYSISGNGNSVARLVRAVVYMWYKWLRRRSQRTRLTWERYYHDLLRDYPLPQPRIVVKIWQSPTCQYMVRHLPIRV